MGINPYHSSSCSECHDAPTCTIINQTVVEAPQGNPVPTRFVVEKAIQRGPYVIAVITYPDCTNFEGRKILVYRGCTVLDIQNARWLDPHFSDSKDYFAPFARFEPTPDGWRAAQLLTMLL